MSKYNELFLFYAMFGEFKVQSGDFCAVDYINCPKNRHSVLKKRERLLYYATWGFLVTYECYYDLYIFVALSKKSINPD